MVHNKRRATLFGAWGMCAVLLSASAFGTAGSVSAGASSYFCDDGLYEGTGTHVSANYTIEYDYYVEHNEYLVGCAPSLMDGGSGYTNNCTSVAATNVVAFYDRYYPNLIPDYEPGYVVNGYYWYYPNLGSSAIATLHATLYDYIGVNSVAAGATENDVKNGLKRYINEKGYSVTYSSMYESATTVNLTKVQQMVNNNQVALVFFAGYHFIYGFSTTDNVRTVIRMTSDAGHAMMIFGYFTVDYYKNNQKFLTETYLEASSCNQFGDQGYIKLNDYGTIVDAVLVAVS